ncbi:terminase large subunit [Macrococcus carouselicus]|uniref:terminase large subunit n=1 Tax=Macrococcus carouselicus TaxID=69969 RepID=UPI001FB77463|nr:terminase TerL endonuclease subunit [Macrococcus carouselicus]
MIKYDIDELIKTDKATLYAYKVVSGEILASKKNIASCKRHLNDLENGIEGYEYRQDLADKVARYLGTLPDIKSGVPLPLLLFQYFVYGSLYGWVHEGTNMRRFTKAYISTARKQSKSMTSAGIAQYEMLFGTSPERQREIYISSNAYKQSRIIFEMATSQINLLKKSSKYLAKNIKTLDKEIKYLKDESIIKALTNSPDSADGTNPSCIILDEFGEMKDTVMYERLKTGMSQQSNPLTLIVSTAGSNLNNPMYAEEYQYITKLLNGEIQDDNYFVYCAELDNEREMEDESKWIKAMPLLESESKRDIILRNIKTDIKEQREKGKMTAIKIKNFNLWQNNSDLDDAFVSIKKWEQNVINKPDITGTDTWIGVDLSRLHDISAVSMAHAIDNNKVWVDTHGFFGYEGSIELKSTRDKIDYNKLIDLGYGTLTNSDSGVIDYQQITDFIIKYATDNQLNIKGVFYDRNLANEWITDMNKRCPHFKLIEVAQSMMGLSETIKQFRYDVLQSKVVHSNNELLNIAVRNAVIKTVNDNILINKTKARNKIDSIVALMNAYTEAQYYKSPKQSLSEKIKNGRGIQIL